jgi:hypothetical protein
MMAAPDPAAEREAAWQAAVRNYELFAVAALAILALALVQRGYGGLCMLPVTAGLFGIWLRWGLAPVILLLSLVFQLFDRWSGGWSRYPDWDLSDLLQCAAVLGYVSAQSRLVGLTKSLIPADPRVRQRLIDKPAQRPVPAEELTRLLIMIVACALLASWFWASLPTDWNDLGLPASLWQMLLLLWLLGVGLYVASGLFSYLGRERMTPEEAMLLLQDQLWADHRGEQRRSARWLAWARLRYQRRLDKEMP